MIAEQQLRENAHRLVDAEDARDGDRLDELLDKSSSSDYVGHLPGARDPVRVRPRSLCLTLFVVLAAVAGLAFVAAPPGSTLAAAAQRVPAQPQAPAAPTDTTVVLNPSGDATLKIAPPGKHIAFTGISIYRLAGGKIVEGWFNNDGLGLQRQLGLIA